MITIYVHPFPLFSLFSHCDAVTAKVWQKSKVSVPLCSPFWFNSNLLIHHKSIRLPWLQVISSVSEPDQSVCMEQTRTKALLSVGCCTGAVVCWSPDLPSFIWSLLKCSSRDRFCLVSTPLTKGGRDLCSIPSLLQTVRAGIERMKCKKAANGRLGSFFSWCSSLLTVEVKAIAPVSLSRWGVLAVPSTRLCLSISA